MRGKATREEITDMLMKDPKHSDVTAYELNDIIPHLDKELFRGFKEHKISVSQLKARVYKRRFKIDYVCFDDIKDELDPKWLDEKEKAKFRPKMKMIFGDNFKSEAILRDLLPHEVNDKCLRSINWHILHTDKEKVKNKDRSKGSQNFRSVERHVKYPNDKYHTEA
jgi:hypothetical protein